MKPIPWQVAVLQPATPEETATLIRKFNEHRNGTTTMWLAILQLPSGKTVLREINAANFALAAKLVQQEADDNEAVVVSVQWVQR